MKVFPAFLTILLPGFFSCSFAPINNQYEKAGTLKKGNVEVIGSFSGYSMAGLTTNSNVGFRAGVGVTDKFDLKLRYERLIPGERFDEEDLFDNGDLKGVNYFSIVPKFALIPEKLSLLVPLSHYSFKEVVNGKENKGTLNSIAPQLIYTLTTSKNKSDFSFGFKADGLFNEDGGGGVLFGTTMGAGFSSDLSKWAVRPEIGASLIGGGAIVSYGVGVQFIISKGKK